MSQSSEKAESFLLVARKYLPENEIEKIILDFESEQILKSWKLVLDEVYKDLPQLNLVNLDVIVSQGAKVCLHFLRTDVSKL